ncbi:MAG: hypothetical protein PQJ58_13530 [Spirochaetales bacterium]|nr:hypothetical protein [Spirochaetales bacterium]
MVGKRDAGANVNLSEPEARQTLIRYINLKLAALGLPYFEQADNSDLEIAEDLIKNFKEKNRLLAEHHCPADKRIQDFLDSYLKDAVDEVPRLPTNTFVLDRYGLARELSLAPDRDDFHTDIINSYRIKQGVLHNPKNDRRTTKGSFHVADGGLPVPLDKKEVPRKVFAHLYKEALTPPEELMKVPFTSSQKANAQTFISLLLRPTVCPEVPGYISEKTMEIRFFVPGNLVANLDFVESIFGNAGDPVLPQNDAGLDPEHWTGHSGAVILAPHLIYTKKKDLGLPHYDFATERQKKDGMCWKSEDELYNDGSPFKITCRDEKGVIVTLIADNYFGYSKKEVKTQIGYSANLFGLAEEEHAGGALAFPSYNLGMKFIPDSNLQSKGQTFRDTVNIMGDRIEVRPEGYAVDKEYPSIIYIPEDATIDLDNQLASWKKGGKKQQLQILAENTYIHPTGYKVRMEKHPQTPAWRLVGTTAEGTLCHKPCTVSGGGKSEISKSLWDAVNFGPIFVSDIEKDMDRVEEIINKDYVTRYKPGVVEKGHVSRPILSDKRSLGSVIKLLTFSEDASDEYNQWLETIPNYIKGLVFTVKRFYQPEWGDEWRQYFSVDFINGSPGNQLKFQNRTIQSAYLRVGKQSDGTGMTYKLRQDFMPSDKVQWEDDISASVVVPVKHLEYLSDDTPYSSVKLTVNCENRFFQRPDDAIIRGYDKQAEEDLAASGNLIVNFEPLKKDSAKELIEKRLTFDHYTEPMQKMIREAASEDFSGKYFVSSSHPRIVDGAPTKNPRYLQTRPDLIDSKPLYLAEVGTRLHRQVPTGKAVHLPVNAVLPGRRNNPADRKAGIRALAVYGPIHFQELPELFMDFVASLTGKSPSTTGAGTEGALTKGPFNALVPTSDLNNALLSFIVTGYNGFTSAAGYIGTRYKVDHDVSLMIPELWARMSEDERDPKKMIQKGYLEAVKDFEHKGNTVPASRLGYRITREFTTHYLGRLFDNPELIFNDEMLRPETQSLEDYIDGIANVCEAQEKVARQYLEDGSVEAAIPPLKAILHIMVHGSYEGKTIHDKEVRDLFDRDVVMKSSWYKKRLTGLQKKQITLYNRHVKYMKSFIETPKYVEEAARLNLDNRLEVAKALLAEAEDKSFTDKVFGTLGLDPLFRK